MNFSFDFVVDFRRLTFLLDLNYVSVQYFTLRNHTFYPFEFFFPTWTFGFWILFFLLLVFFDELNRELVFMHVHRIGAKSIEYHLGLLNLFQGISFAIPPGRIVVGCEVTLKLILINFVFVKFVWCCQNTV